MSISEQCRLLQVPRSSFYYRSQRSSGGEYEVLMQVIDRLFMEEPTFGSRRMSDALQELGYAVGRQRTGWRGLGVPLRYWVTRNLWASCQRLHVNKSETLIS